MAEQTAQRARPFTGDEYLESLRDGREVWIYGERVDDVTAHPAFRNTARMVARLYDALHDPEKQKTLTTPTDTGNGSFTHRFYKPWKDADELVAARDAIAAWSRLTYGWVGRSPDYKAAFGLLELSRQRLRPSLEEATQSICPRCSGAGNIRSVESLALAILRLVGEEARKERTAKVIAQLPMDVANYILNEKRDWVQTLQESNSVTVVLLGNPDLETPNYTLRRVRDDEVGLPENAGTSYKLLAPKADISVAYEEVKKLPKTEEAAVSNVLPTTPVPTPAAPPPAAEEPVRAPPPKPGIFTRLWAFLFGSGAAPAAPPPAP
jgi:hypothetical protein